jgi:hypothetical protein
VPNSSNSRPNRSSNNRSNRRSNRRLQLLGSTWQGGQPQYQQEQVQQGLLHLDSILGALERLEVVERGLGLGCF